METGNPWGRPSRRPFLRGLGLAGAGLVPRRRARAAPGPLFEEVPPAASGISFVHDTAMSPERYLPETVGPGCALIDYDNDGRLDLFVCSFVEYRLAKNVFCGDN